MKKRSDWEKSMKTKFIKIMIVGAFSILLLTGILILPPKLIKIKNISCSSQFGECSEIISDKLKKYEGDNLSSVKNGIKDAFGNVLLVDKYSIEYKFPNKVNINLIEKTPVSALTNIDKNMFALVDNEGFVISKSVSSELPYIIIDSQLPETGTKVEEKAFFLLHLMEDIYSAFQIKEGKVDGNSLVIELEGGLRVIFPLEGDKQTLVGSLVLLYGELQRSENTYMSEGQKFDTIDLRYKNPVLR